MVFTGQHDFRISGLHESTNLINIYYNKLLIAFHHSYGYIDSIVSMYILSVKQLRIISS